MLQNHKKHECETAVMEEILMPKGKILKQVYEISNYNLWSDLGRLDWGVFLQCGRESLSEQINCAAAPSNICIIRVACWERSVGCQQHSGGTSLGLNQIKNKDKTQ